ncbi:MAG TPA: SAM-dependent chlorinase/fluorinase, partial [Microthrixaceae bacterium]|nr:SAM-dependent chlorinase/fluorinase [Microthrixaceae bacterium]
AGGRAVFVGPDNGLLAPAVGMIGGAERAVVLDRPEYHLEAPGPTFAGRDVFAPVVAHLCLGVGLDEVGTPVDTTTLMPGTLPITHAEGDQLTCEVLWIDRFGNVQLNVDPDELEGWGDRITITVGERNRVGRRAGTYAEIGVSEIGLVVDSYGLVSLAANRVSAAETLGLGEADEVRLIRIPDDGGVEDEGGDRDRAVTTSVALGRRSPPRDRSSEGA